MSRKNNVNPDHYKVEGRERRGEPIDAEKQRFVQYRKSARRGGPGRDFMPGKGAGGVTARPSTRVSSRQRRKKEGSESNETNETETRNTKSAGSRNKRSKPSGAAQRGRKGDKAATQTRIRRGQRSSAMKETNTRTSPYPAQGRKSGKSKQSKETKGRNRKSAGGGNKGSTPAAAAQRRRKGEKATPQTSIKRGLRSSSMKEANTRHSTNPAPAAAPVAGAFGRSGSRSEVEEQIINQEPGSGKPDDFLRKRRRQNKKARK